MKRSSVIWTVVIVLAVIIMGGIWYWSASTGTPSVATTTTTTTTPPISTPGGPMIPATSPTTTTAIVLNTGSTSTLGTYLVATDGMTLYEDMSDRVGVSTCTGACAVAWPPYTVSASVAASLLGSTPGVPGKIGTIKRANGTLQVTYNGMPLYFYEKDTVVGNVNGQNVSGFMVVTP